MHLVSKPTATVFVSFKGDSGAGGDWETCTACDWSPQIIVHVLRTYELPEVFHRNTSQGVTPPGFDCGLDRGDVRQTKFPTSMSRSSATQAKLQGMVVRPPTLHIQYQLETGIPKSCHRPTSTASSSNVRRFADSLAHLSTSQPIPEWDTTQVKQDPADTALGGTYLEARTQNTASHL
ncbi:hypothetical protein LZ31DRAFT_273768 [Colletotrichum somersetense]|nr:hypothetical protein LZ31DRAFT_273768 [Colletotrichum somersetense]